MTSEEQMIRDEIAQVEKVLIERQEAFEHLNAKLMLWGEQPRADIDEELNNRVHRVSIAFVEKFAQPTWFTRVFVNADRWYAKEISKVRHAMGKKLHTFLMLEIETDRASILIRDLEDRLFDLQGDLRNLS